MQSRTLFGSYYPVVSIVHKLNPIIKLINFLICIITLILTNNLYINIFMFILTIIMMFLSYVPIRFYFKTFYFLRYIYLIIVFVCYYLNINLTDTLVYILKLITIIEYLKIFSYTTSPSETIYAIEKTLSPFNFLYLPLNKIAIKINNILRYIPSLETSKQKILKSLSSRGLDYYHTNIIKKIYITLKIRKNLFLVNKDKNKEIYLCSKYRLYNAKKYRTNYRTNKIGFYDIVFIAFHLLIIISYIKIRGIL